MGGNDDLPLRGDPAQQLPNLRCAAFVQMVEGLVEDQGRADTETRQKVGGAEPDGEKGGEVFTITQRSVRER